MLPAPSVSAPVAKSRSRRSPRSPAAAAVAKPDEPCAPSAGGRRARRLIVAAIFGTALAIRLFHIWQIRHAPFFDLKLGDAAAYDAWARRTVGGDWVGRDVFYQAPLYPYFLALVYSTVGSSPLTVRLVQAIVSAGSCALLADAGWRIFSRCAGIAAGLLLATYPPAIFLDTLIQKSVLDLFFLSLALWLISRLLAVSRRSIWWQLGLAFGCLSLTRENAGVLIVPTLIWLALQRSIVVRDRAIFGALFFAGLATVLAPVAIRNAIVGGEFFVTTAQLGPNLYIGNNEHSDGTYTPLRPLREKASFERQDATDLAEQALGHSLTPGEVSSYYTGQVLRFAATQPSRWLRLLGRKFLLAWNATEIADTEDQYTYAHWSWPLAIGAMWNLGVLAPLAALGIWITAGEWRRLWILYVMLATYVASVVLFYVFARYRFPMVPFLILFAGAGLVGLPGFLRRHRAPQLAGCPAAVAAVAVLCNLPMIPRNKLEAATRYNDGVGLDALHRSDEAIREYQAAVTLDPGLAPAHNDLGLLLARQGRLADAADELAKAVALSPELAKTHNNLGVVLGQQGDLARAIPSFETALRLDPNYAEARRNLTAVRNQRAGQLAREGRLDAAAAELEQALRVAPDRADLHNNLGTVLAQQGRLTAAAAEFERALALNPTDAQTRRNLERIRPRR